MLCQALLILNYAGSSIHLLKLSQHLRAVLSTLTEGSSKGSVNVLQTHVFPASPGEKKKRYWVEALS